MGKVITDKDLLQWEAFATPGKFGFPERAHVVFRCLSNPRLRPRYVEQDTDKSGAERAVATFSEAELRELLEQSEEIP